MTSDPIRGRCLCGRVTFALTEPTEFAGHCHCESCRRAHAAPFVTWTSVQDRHLQIGSGHDDLRGYESSEGVVRTFCSFCGSQLFYRGRSAPGRVYVPVAVLDRIDRDPDAHVSYEEHVPWIEGLERLACFRAKSDEPMRWR